MTTLSELLLENNPDIEFEQNEVLDVASADSATYDVDNGTRVVELGFSRDDVAALQRSGDTLILTLENGQVIRLDGYYASDEKKALDFEDDGAGLFATDGNGSASVGLLAGGIGILGAAALAGGGGDDSGSSSGIAPPTVVVGAERPDGLLDVSGMGLPNATVTVTMPSGEEVTVMADATGAYSATSTVVQPDDGTVTATQVDEDGNGPSDAGSDTYDIAPDVPAPTVVVGEDRDDGLLDVSGVGLPNAMVTVVMPSGEEITTTADGSGNYSVTSTAVQPDDGTVTATQVDEDGNGPGDAGSDTYEFGAEAPGAPGINELAIGVDTVIEGTGEAGATVNVTDEDGNVLGSATVNASGTWSVVPGTPLEDGDVVRATQTKDGLTGGQTSETIMVDTDDDGTADATDTDDDNDGVLDVDETGASEIAFTVVEAIPDNADGVRILTPDRLYSMDIYYGDQSTYLEVPEFDTVTSVIEDIRSNGDDLFTELVFDTTNSPTAFTFDTLSLGNLGHISDTRSVRDTLIWSEPGEWTETSSLAVMSVDPTASNGVGSIIVADPDDTSADSSALDTFNYILAVDNTVSNALFNVEGELDGHAVTHAFDDSFDQVSLYISSPNGTAIRWNIEADEVSVGGEGVIDTDEDGILDSRDFDSDSDKIWDIFEGETDADDDGDVASRDTDSDGDSVSDTDEVALGASELAALASGTASSDGYLILEDTGGLTLDLDQFSNVTDLQYIDIEGATAQSLTISAQDVLDTSASDQLYVFGDANDTVNADGFTLMGESAFQGEVVDVYTSGGATLLIEQDVSVVI